MPTDPLSRHSTRAWLRFLDRVKPRYGVGGRPSPRIIKATPAMTTRIEEILRRRKEEGR